MENTSLSIFEGCLFGLFKERIKFTNFRYSDHCLMIEKGRHKRPTIPREQRSCPTYPTLVKNEVHFLPQCSAYTNRNDIPYRWKFCRWKVTKIWASDEISTDETFPPTKHFHRRNISTDETFPPTKSFHRQKFPPTKNFHRRKFNPRKLIPKIFLDTKKEITSLIVLNRLIYHTIDPPEFL